jgi:hypothetical protein
MTADGKVILSALDVSDSVSSTHWRTMGTYGDDNSHYLYFRQTYRDNSGDDAGSRGGLTNAYVIGRDDKGPSVLAVSAWTGEENSRERADYPYTLNGNVNTNFKNIPANYITDTDTMAYIVVQVNEPILFNNTSDLGSISLQVNALPYGGKTYAEAQPISASFYKYAPAVNDGTPAMIFQYKVPAERAENNEVFIADSITVGTSVNNWMINNITDVSGNVYGQVKDNKTPQTKEYVFSGKTVFDFNPIKVESISVTPNPNPNAGRGEADQIRTLNGSETVNVALKLNKAIAGNVNDIPKLTFAATNKRFNIPYALQIGSYDAATRTINYIISSYALAALDGFLTIEAMSDTTIVDEAGYELADSFTGDYIPAHENYLRDTSPPEVSVDITASDDDLKIYKILVTATDDSLTDGKA